MALSARHRNLIRMVVSGKADVAAIDSKTWALAQHYEPAARDLLVVGRTQKRGGLPFIKGLPAREI